MLSQDLSNYIESHSSEEPALLQRLRRETHLKVLYPRMLSSIIQGRFLARISRLLRPKRILEIGTFTGYGTICLAEGLVEDGKIITIDINPERDFVYNPYWTEAGIIENVETLHGPALDLLSDIEGPFDLVYIDADKQNYLTYYEAILPKVRSGGMIMVDNVLWFGKVVDPEAQDKETRGIKQFNDFVVADPRVECLLISIDDGIMWIQKR